MPCDGDEEEDGTDLGSPDVEPQPDGSAEAASIATKPSGASSEGDVGIDGPTEEGGEESADEGPEGSYSKLVVELPPTPAPPEDIAIGEVRVPRVLLLGVRA